MDKSKFTFKDSNGDDVNFCSSSFKRSNKQALYLLMCAIKSLGCGRSILVDKQNNVVCGDKVMKAAKEAGVQKVRIIETTGDELIVVKRTDLSLNSKKGYELSLVDNSIQENSDSWDVKAIYNAIDEIITFNPCIWGAYNCLVEEVKIEDLLKEGSTPFQRFKKPSSIDSEIGIDNQLSLFDL